LIRGGPAAVAHGVTLAALGAIRERLSDIAVNDQTARFHDLAELVLSVVMDVYFHPVYSGGYVIAG